MVIFVVARSSWDHDIVARLRDLRSSSPERHGRLPRNLRLNSIILWRSFWATGASMAWITPAPKHRYNHQIEHNTTHTIVFCTPSVCRRKHDHNSIFSLESMVITSRKLDSVPRDTARHRRQFYQCSRWKRAADWLLLREISSNRLYDNADSNRKNNIVKYQFIRIHGINYLKR